MQDVVVNFGDEYWRSAPTSTEPLPDLTSESIGDDDFKLLADNIPTLCWIANGDGYIVWYNRRWHEYCGTTPDQMEGWGWQSVHDPAVLPDVLERWTAAIVAGSPFEMTFPLRGADGVFRPFLTRIQPVRGADSRIARWFGVNTDVSAQYDAEAARDDERDQRLDILDRSRQRRLMWDTSPDLFSVIDLATGNFDAVNPAWVATLGWTEHEMVGAPYSRFVHPDDGDASDAAFAQVRDGSPVLRFENRYRDKAGGWHWLSWVAMPEGGKLYSSTRDITDEKLGKQALLLHQNIVQSHLSPVVAFDREYRLTAFNQAHADEFMRVFGVQAQVGDILPDAFPSDQAETLRALMDRALAGETFTIVEQFGDLDLAKPCFEISYFPMHDETGRIFGAFHHANDISARLRTQADLEEAQDALRQSQKMEAVGQLTGGLAHDFNNLLTGMMGNLELLQLRVARGRLDDLDRFINAAQGAGRRAASLTQRLLAFSRRQTLDPKPTDVNRLIAGMEDLLRRTVGAGIEIEVVGAAGLWTALIDPGQLENALLNLCINGRDAMPDGGRLTIETANKWIDERSGRERDLPPGQYLSVCVTDNGTGMSAETIARAFDPFFTTKPIGEGTGLGLSMIYGFARQSGGQVRIYSEVGAGTTVCVYLPRHLGEAEDVLVVEHDTDQASGSGETVLVVDDEPTIRHLIDEVLDDLGYTVIGAADGAAGLKVLQSGARIDLLITDVGLPNGMNGRQVADAARSLRPGLQVLFITGYAENAAVGNGHMEAGMELLTKPFSMDDLGRRVRDMLRKA